MRKLAKAVAAKWLLLSMLGCWSFSTVNAIDAMKLDYSQACNRDTADIIALYDSEAFSEDDKHKLVVFPKQVRSNILGKAIRQGRLWIAREKNKGPIVSFLKMYLVEDQEELQGILRDEIRCVNTLEHKVTPDTVGYYTTASLGVVYKFDEKPEFRSARIKFKWHPKQTYIYFGSTYTVEDYRGVGVSTALERFAMEQIKQSVIDDIKLNNSTQLFYIYGVVKDNENSLGRVRVFSEFSHRYVKLKLRLVDPAIDDYFEQATTVRFYRYPAFKPVFQMVGKALVKLPDDAPETLAGSGYGCLVGLDLGRAKK